MDHINRTYLIILFCCILTAPVSGQNTERDSYGFSFRPALNYNSVDGVKLGVWMEGGDYLTENEGPHRLDLGIWLATKFPRQPVSYHVSLEEPVTTLSNFGSEFILRFSSTMVGGYQTHAAGFRKRWEVAFDATRYWEAGVNFAVENRFNDNYTLYPQLWSDEWKGLVHLSGSHQHINRAGVFYSDAKVSINTIENAYTVGTISVTQKILMTSRSSIRIRGFAGVAGENSHPEYRFMRGFPSAMQTLNNPLTRSRGTIPPGWVEGGFVHMSGGANLRGYTGVDAEVLNDGGSQLYRSIGALNLELDFPNPVDGYLVRSSSIISGFFAFKSYLFADTGFPIGLTAFEPDQLYADAGLGVALSVNIPDDQDKPRGFVIRYELPLWLSSPQTGSEFRIRHLLGVGAVISF